LYRQRAFSLLELVMVMGILVVMAGIALPRFGTAHLRYSVELAARRVSADLSYARDVARQKSSAQEIVFDQDAETYTLSGVGDVDRAGVDYTVSLTEEPYEVEVVSASFENANGHIGSERVRFDMWGQPESGDPNESEPFAPLISGSIIIGAGSETRTITITPVTGKVTIQ
jgi:prepilin-type N-terminal cleavage/methylation domain-containing protein